MSLNNLTVEIYEPFTTTRREVDLTHASIAEFGTYFPGGLYDTATALIPMDITESSLITEGDRLVIRNGLTIVYEGEIGDIGRVVGGGAEQGLVLECHGLWGALLGRRTIDRRWCDTRISAAAWQVHTGSTASELATYDRTERLRITPKSEQWANNDSADLKYVMPTGETVGRVSLTYDFKEAAKAYTFRLYDFTAAATFWSLTADANTADDSDNPAGTNSQDVYLQLINSSGGNQTGVSDGTEYGEISGVKVYRYQSDDATVPEVYLDNLAKDCQAAVSDINSDTGKIGDYTGGSPLALEPFISNGREPWNSILQRAAGYGDTAFAEWYVRLLDSEQASTPDGKPVIEVAQYPVLTDYDYGIRLDSENLIPQLDIRRSAANVANWIVISYKDTDEQKDIILTPDDDANLKDATSITDWGQRDLVVSIGEASNTTALNIGRRILASRKDARFYINGPIVVKGFIEGKDGNPVPASQIQAGKRVRVLNYLTDLVGVSGAGLTFIISATQYDDAGETCRISTGVSDNMAVILAQLKLKFA